MVLKRRKSDEVGGDEPESSKRRISDVTNLSQEFVESLSDNKIIQTLIEPVIRKVVREEVERCFHPLYPSSRGLPSLTSPDKGRDWMLRFINQPLPKIYTGNKVEDKNGAVLQIEIVDATTKTRVCGGPLSSLKLEIVVLHGDYDDDQQEDQGDKYFSSRVLRAREGKKPLVTGKLHVNLKDGVACIADICCIDNSRCTRSGKFRLGVRVVPSSSRGSEVREAVSDAFSVKDRRGEACRKHQHPSLDDAVWRLTKIRKDGKFHKRLEGIGITTVRDFLQMFESNPSSLKETLILKCGNNTNKTWNAIVEHATSCQPHDHDGPPISRQATQNHVADYLGAATSNNVTYQLSVGDVSMQSFMTLPAQWQPFQSSLPLGSPYLQSIYPGLEHAPYYQSSTLNCFETNNQIEVPVPDPTQFDTDQETDISIIPCSAPVSMEGPIQPISHQLPVDYAFHAEPPNPFQWQWTGSFGTPGSEARMELLTSLISNNGSPRAAWCKVRAAVKCRILIRQSRVMRAEKGKAKC